MGKQLFNIRILKLVFIAAAKAESDAPAMPL